MNLHSLAGHTVDLKLLPANPTVLDVGCRWWDFADEILDARPDANLKCVDPARDVPGTWDQMMRNHSGNIWFGPVAIVGPAQPSRQRLAHFSTGEGDFLTNLGSYYDAEMYEVDCITIIDLMRLTNVQHFDLVKLDCEGSEFDILENWPGPIATQISVEFHDWTGPRKGYDYEALWKKLPWYKVIQHGLSQQGTGIGHWDSLLVLR